MKILSLRTPKTVSLLGKIYEPSGETRRLVLTTLLHGFVEPLWHLIPDLSRFTFVTTVDKNLMKFRPLVLSDLLLVLANKDKEPYVQKIFRPKSGDTVVDVGAHIGFYTLKAARDVGLEGTVIAIEPDPQSFLLLKENISINNFHNVIAVNAALSDITGRRLFYTCAEPIFSGFQPSSQTRIKDAKVVETLTLDQLLQNLGIDQIDWIKVDAEGEELRILKGGKRVLQKVTNMRIIMEVSNGEIIEYLRKMDFNIKHLGELYYLAFRH